MNLIKVSSIFFTIAILSGCAIANDPSVHHTRSTTVGQELIDLQKAKDNNIITDEEFEETKSDILKSSTFKLDL